MPDYDLLVIGSGPGGQSAAIAAAKLGKRVALIERKPYVGGVSLQTGTIPSKALREAAYLNSRTVELGMRRALQPRAVTESGFLLDVLAQKDRVIDRKEAQLLEKLMREGITLIPGEARFVDAYSLEVRGPKGDVQTLSADYFVLSTGSRPRRPANVPFDKERILDSTSILKIRQLPTSMIVIGGGVIACEFATMFAALGTRIRLIDSHSQLLDYLDTDIVQGLVNEIKTMGVNVCTNTRIGEIHREGDKVVVAIEGGEAMQADAVLFALGREPNSGSLQLERAGVDVDDRGWIAINANHQSSQPHIYVVGDLAGRPSLASTAMQQGRLVALHAINHEEFPKAAILPMAIYTIPELSYVGETERELQQRQADYVKGYAYYAKNARGQIIGNEHGMLKLLVDKNTRAILGVHILGESASELVHIGQMAMACNATVDALSEMVFNYPTLSHCYTRAALECQDQLD